MNIPNINSISSINADIIEIMLVVNCKGEAFSADMAMSPVRHWQNVS
jgi:hypothetical protein